MVATALARMRFSGLCIMRRSTKMPAKEIAMTADEVRRGSQVQ